MNQLRNLNNLLEQLNVKGKLLVYRQKNNKKYELAKWVFDRAIRSGELTPGQPIVIATAGNFGIGMAILAKKNGCPFYAIATLSKLHNNAEEVITSYGGKVIHVPRGFNKSPISVVREKTKALAEELGAYTYDQFGDETHVKYYKDLAEKVFEGVDEPIDCYVDRKGSGATIAGFEKVLKQKYKSKVFFAIKQDMPLHIQSDEFLAKTSAKQINPPEGTDLQEFENILKETERLVNLEYSALSLFCAVQWLKQNEGKTAFVFIGD